MSRNRSTSIGATSAPVLSRATSNELLSAIRAGHSSDVRHLLSAQSDQDFFSCVQEAKALYKQSLRQQGTAYLSACFIIKYLQSAITLSQLKLEKQIQDSPFCDPLLRDPQEPEQFSFHQRSMARRTMTRRLSFGLFPQADDSAGCVKIERKYAASLRRHYSTPG